MRRLVVIAWCATALAACQALLDLPTKAGPDDQTDADASEAGALRDGEVGDVVADAGPRIICPDASRGPALVPVDSFCIDRTEVTVANFREYLDAGRPPTSPARAGCTNDAGFKIQTMFDGGPPPLDVSVLVPFCEAVAYCAWAGKHLCGANDGGSLSTDALGDPAQNQWLRACGGPEGHNYPYGPASKPDACPPGAFFTQAYDYLRGVDALTRGCESPLPSRQSQSGLS